MASNQTDLLIQTVMNEATPLGDFWRDSTNLTGPVTVPAKAGSSATWLPTLLDARLPGPIPSIRPGPVIPIRRKGKSSWPRVSEDLRARRRPHGLPINSSGCS